MFATSKGLVKKPSIGRLYVLRITLRCGKVVHKCGMTHSDRATSRMMEILRSFFNTYRYIPQCELRRDKKVLVPLLVETHMHELLDDWSYIFEKPFDGHTEFFENLDEEAVLEYLDEFEYTDLIKGKVVMKEKDLDAIRTVLDDKIFLPQCEEEIPF